MQRIVCPDCGMSTWDDRFGCRLPGCENYAVLVEPVGVLDTIYSDEQDPAQEGRSD